MEFLRSWVERELGLEPTVESVEPGRENLFFTLDSGRPGPCLLLEGHTDVVSEGERGRWSVDPFGGELKDGRIYGRGACDMKAGLAVNLVTAKALLAAGVPWKGRLALCFVCDEEGMMIGIKDFIRRGHADGVDACLVSGARGKRAVPQHEGGHPRGGAGAGQDGPRRHAADGVNPNTRLARIILAFERFESERSRAAGRTRSWAYPRSPSPCCAPRRREPPPSST